MLPHWQDIEAAWLSALSRKTANRVQYPHENRSAKISILNGMEWKHIALLYVRWTRAS